MHVQGRRDLHPIRLGKAGLQRRLRHLIPVAVAQAHRQQPVGLDARRHVPAWLALGVAGPESVTLMQQGQPVARAQAALFRPALDLQHARHGHALPLSFQLDGLGQPQIRTASLGAGDQGVTHGVTATGGLGADRRRTPLPLHRLSLDRVRCLQGLKVGGRQRRHVLAVPQLPRPAPLQLGAAALF
ncbi:hypothetical protein D3C71_1569730 [compost metagenome]